MKSSPYSHQHLIEQAALSKEDLREISQCRRSYTRLGFAYQLGFVRLKNRFPVQRPFEVMDDLLQFVSVQIDIDPSEIHHYTSRQPTISEHQAAIRRYLNLRDFVDADIDLVSHFIFSQACRLEQTGLLFALVEQYLRGHHILQPADSTLRRMIGTQRELARQHIYERITDSLDQETQRKFDSLLEVDERKVSPLQQLKAVPRKPSPTALLQLTDKLEAIAYTGVLDVDLSWLNNNYQRSLTNYVQRCSAHRLRELTLSHRYAAITCFLWQSYRDTTPAYAGVTSWICMISCSTKCTTGLKRI